MNSAPPEDLITIDEFSKVKLKIGRVTAAEAIPGMTKVFNARVDLGAEERELAVGGAAFYRPEEFVGRIVVVCTNLQPKKLGGMVSRGMLLAADGPNGKPIFLTAAEEVTAGSPVH
ncbi:MAG: methionine--tRNA ligase [Nitrososphaera sp.]